MPRSVAILALLIVGSLAWAYYLAHPPKELPSSADQSIEVWRVNTSAVRTITFRTEKGEVVLEPQSHEEGESPFVWVTHHKPDRSTPGGKSEDEEKKPAARRFKGGASVEKAVENLTALVAHRRIGKLTGLDGEAFGFPNDEHFLQIETTDGGEALRLELGALTYGKIYRYVHHPASGTVYLLRASLLNSLMRGKQRLLDGRILAEPIGTARRIDLQMGQDTVNLWKLPEPQDGPSEWGIDPDGSEGDEQIAEWIAELAKLRVVDYLDESLAEEDESRTPDLEARIFGDEEEPRSWIKLYRGGASQWQAVSSHTRFLVKISPRQAKKVITGGRKIAKQAAEK